MSLTETQEETTLYTPAEVGELLGCSRAHVYRLIASGVLSSVDISQPGAQRAKTRVSAAALREYLKR